MRNLVQPLPSVHCEHCGGELLFKRVERYDQVLEIEVQAFVCAKCGREHSHKVIHDPYTVHTPTARKRKDGPAKQKRLKDA